jgi:excisionase family DNA binding protein
MATLSPVSHPDTASILTADQLAQRWGCSRAHIYNLMKRGMPSLKIGACRRFRPAECEAWCEAGEHRGDAAA